VNKNVPLFSYWNGEKLSYVEARKKIYCPIYSEYVKKTEAWKQLKDLREQGYNIQILGYDGYDISSKSMSYYVNDSSRPFGHELVLACLLQNETPWVDENSNTDVESAMEKIDVSEELKS